MSLRNILGRSDHSLITFKRVLISEMNSVPYTLVNDLLELGHNFFACSFRCNVAFSAASCRSISLFALCSNCCRSSPSYVEGKSRRHFRVWKAVALTCPCPSYGYLQEEESPELEKVACVLTVIVTTFFLFPLFIRSLLSPPIYLLPRELEASYTEPSLTLSLSVSDP